MSLRPVLILAALWFVPMRVEAQAVSASPSTAAADPVAEVLATARQAIDGGRTAAALDVLRKAPAADPRVRVLTGVALYHANDAAGAIRELTSILPGLAVDSPEWREATQVLGLAHYLAGQLPRAIPFLEKTRAFRPESSELAYALGMAYIQTRQPD